ncbi:hypothetical protein [Paenibacillus glucanolyticus]|uniref:hypothetical protein n=1 Tax=Paenibacillus glucanolyticus TaxID=59843 RepID=UPI00096F4C71|nr:hypothetical protein [Paenibacillus glucanolyticus]MPY17257.1 hypothetical protein [Paenibacillus glucanolyticus]OMF80134.1 hypothetical protein BK142_06530 [Paenibacillus glucanolyticus]
MLTKQLNEATETGVTNEDASQQSYIMNKLGYTAALSLLRTAREQAVPIVISMLEELFKARIVM